MTGKNTYTLATTTRDLGHDVAELRAKGSVPLVLYGKGAENQHLTAPKTAFAKIAQEAGESALIDLQIDGKDAGKVLIKDLQRDAVKHTIIHGDLYQINMNETLTTEIPLVFTGVAPAVKELGGIMVSHIDKIEVECLPGDLVQEIMVDISGLVDFTSSLKVSDLQLPEGITVLNDQTVSVITISEPRKVEDIDKEEVTTPPKEGDAGEAAAAEEKKEEGAAEEK